VGYAPKSIDHIHDVLSAVLRTAVKWGASPGQSGSRHRHAQAQMRSAQVGVNGRTSHGTAGCAEADGSHDGRVGDSLRHTAWRVPRVQNVSAPERDLADVSANVLVLVA